MAGWDVAIVAGFAVAYGLVSRVVERSLVTGPMLFVGFGLILGTDGLGVLDVPFDDEGVKLLAEATLGLLLFSDAVRIDVTKLRHDYALPARMLALGLPLAIGLGTLAGALLLDIDLALAALVAAILAPTDAALGQAVVTSPALPIRVRQSLNVESGLNDGIAAPAVTVFIAITMSEEASASAEPWVQFAAEQIGFGVLVGMAVGLGGGWVVKWCSARNWMDGAFRQIAVLSLAVLAFVVANGIGGNGFISTFVGGFTFGMVAREVCPHVEEFTDDLAQLLAMASFIVFGAIIIGPSLDQIDWRVAAYVVASLVLVRPVAIGLSLIGSGLRLPTVAFFGWFGPRGLASIIFGLTAVEELGDAVAQPIFVVVSWTVLVSIVAHGLSATPAAAAYGRWWESRADPSMPEAQPMGDQRVKRRPAGWEPPQVP